MNNWDKVQGKAAPPESARQHQTSTGMQYEKLFVISEKMMTEISAALKKAGETEMQAKLAAVPCYRTRLAPESLDSSLHQPNPVADATSN